MKIEEAVGKLSREMGLELEPREIKTYGHPILANPEIFLEKERYRDGKQQQAELFYDDQYYGFVVLITDSDNSIVSFTYRGKHPILLTTEDWRDELALSLERIDNKLVRIDTNQASILGFSPVKELSSAAKPYVAGGSLSSIVVSNHKNHKLVKK